MKRVFAVLAVLLFLPAASGGVLAKRHMVAAANPYAAEAGLKMLRQGGSAVDAAIATQLVLNLVEPESSGIGGGAFMLVFDPKTKKMTSFDGRETAPASVTPDHWLDATGAPRPWGEAVPGGQSVGVPGLIAMMEMAHKKYGKLPWASLFEPAITLAEQGVPVTKKLVNLLQNYPQIAAMPDIKRMYTKPDGSLVRPGEKLRNPELAATFRAIAKGGAKAFYAGPIAAAIVDKVRQAPVNPGRMSLSDLARYRAVERKPVCGPYRVYTICSMAPPSSGGLTVIQILTMLERFSPEQLKPNSLSQIHLVTEATHLAYADRNFYIGDPGFVSVPKGLLNRAYLSTRSALIVPDRVLSDVKPGNPPGQQQKFGAAPSREIAGTSHMSIIDSKGVAVSMTTTVESFLGSEMMVKGFVLNNQLTDFAFQPRKDGRLVANAPAPGKRPMSSMSPVIVLDNKGRFLMAIGSPGGAAIIPYVTGALIAILDGGMEPQAAVALPHHVSPFGPLQLEKDTKLSALAPALTAMGYDVRTASTEISGLHAVEKVAGGYIGAADPRREGVVLGD